MSHQATIGGPTVTVRYGQRLRSAALAGAVLIATVSAVLQTFVLAGPAVAGLLAGNAVGEAKEGLRMMWYAMAAVAWTYPIVLIVGRRLGADAQRALLTMITVLTASAGIFGIAAAALLGGARPLWVLPCAVAVLTWLARSPRLITPPDPARRSRGGLVLFWITAVVSTVTALFHVGWATGQSWPAQLLASETPPPGRAEFYAIWLFSCVLFVSVAAVLILSLRLPASAGRWLVRYGAALVAIIAITRTATMIMGLGPDHSPVEPVIAGAVAVLLFVSAPPVR